MKRAAGPDAARLRSWLRAGYGLARDDPAPLTWLFRHLLPLVMRGRGVSRVPISGAVLAGLATAPRYAGGRGT